MAKDFIRGIAEFQDANIWTEQVAYHHFALASRGSSSKCLPTTIQRRNFAEVNRSRTTLKLLFEKEFANQTENKLLLASLANLKMTSTERLTLQGPYSQNFISS
jgi:hypothetical protein